ncbi:UPF0686 protein C11orf1 homolog isoform X3 [Vombatus ursinus]|uniref:UPF0686 protein C11orf1 homolog isoform X3 n=1 Tax=Vombatus ursinus TaxID=29139 RepID=UPI000FFD64F9|nr:UPF0686 protein C11orf1 homolog isoform X3 [Vombatus ursinus]
MSVTHLPTHTLGRILDLRLEKTPHSRNPEKPSDLRGSRKESVGELWSLTQKLSFSCFLTNPQYGCLMHSDGHGEVWTDWNDMSKFFQYGWRCTTNENSYSNRTLMGNWNQERYDLQKIVQPQPLPSQVILLPLLPLASPISREECVVVLGGRIYNPSTPQFNWTLPFLLINDSEDTMQFLIKLDKTLILSTNSVSGLFTHSWNTSVS